MSDWKDIEEETRAEVLAYDVELGSAHLDRVRRLLRRAVAFGMQVAGEDMLADAYAANDVLGRRASAVERGAWDDIGGSS